MDEPLTNDRLMTLMRQSPLLDKIAPILSPELQKPLIELQKQAGNAYAGGEWTVPSTNETIVNPQTPAPKKAETYQALGSAYIALDENREALRSLMNDLGIGPPQPQKSWLQRMADSITEWMR